MSKPFFSIIIPTYNPSKYLPRMLDSISRNECANEIEIILSDDCSPEPFDDVIEKFSSLNIKLITNDKHYGHPRPGRQYGAEAATGEWITFADQDDVYLYNAIDAVKKCILDEKPECVLFCAIFKDYPDGRREYVEPEKAWTHGKFIKKSFWDNENLYYDELDHCEDTNIVTKLQCVLIATKQKVCVFKSPVYVWFENEDSLSHVNNGEYFKDGLHDYVNAVLRVIMGYLEKYESDAELKEKFVNSVVLTLYRIFFYLQCSIYNTSPEEMQRTIDTTKPLYERFKQLAGITAPMLILHAYYDDIQQYNETRADASTEEPFVEKMTFEQFVNEYLENKE